MKTLVLDAMGVIFVAGDDVVELLCPFVHEHGGIVDDGQIEALYNDASLGRLSARRFWEQVQVDPTLEDDLFAPPSVVDRVTRVFCAMRRRE